MSIQPVAFFNPCHVAIWGSVEGITQPEIPVLPNFSHLHERSKSLLNSPQKQPNPQPALEKVDAVSKFQVTFATKPLGQQVATHLAVKKTPEQIVTDLIEEFLSKKGSALRPMAFSSEGYRTASQVGDDWVERAVTLLEKDQAGGRDANSLVKWYWSQMHSDPNFVPGVFYQQEAGSISARICKQMQLRKEFLNLGLEWNEPRKWEVLQFSLNICEYVSPYISDLKWAQRLESHATNGLIARLICKMTPHPIFTRIDPKNESLQMMIAGLMRDVLKSGKGY